MLKKRFTSLFLALAMVLGLSGQAFAVEPSEINLEALAEEYIIKTPEITDDGAREEIKYEGLQNFFIEAKRQYPTMSDLELAQFTMTYTHSDSDTHLPDEIVLEILDAREITTTNLYVLVHENGTDELVSPNQMIVPYGDSTSDDGYMRLTTSKTKNGKVDGATDYTLSVKATWLKYPAFRMTDTLAISYSGANNDKASKYAYWMQTGKCKICSKNLNVLHEYTKTANGTEKRDSGINVDYSEKHVINCWFDLSTPYCPHGTSDGATDTGMEAYLLTHVLVDKLEEAQFDYAHKKFDIEKVTFLVDIGPGGLEVTMDIDGGIKVERYSGEPVALSV